MLCLTAHRSSLASFVIHHISIIIIIIALVSIDPTNVLLPDLRTGRFSQSPIFNSSLGAFVLRRSLLCQKLLTVPIRQYYHYLWRC